jgi:TctA family transporter
MAFIRHPKDFFAGLIFVAFGLAAIIIGSNYSLGSAALSRGDPSVFFSRPISLGMLIAAAALLLLIVAPNFRKKREEAFAEGET